MYRYLSLQVIPDETTHLLSGTPGSPTGTPGPGPESVTGTTPSLVGGARAVDDALLVARLGSIVRGKESKMVKIGRHAAFTLHRTYPNPAGPNPGDGAEEGNADESTLRASSTTPTKPASGTGPVLSSPDLPLQPPPSPVTPTARPRPALTPLNVQVHVQNANASTKSLPRRLPIPPVFTLTPAPRFVAGDSRYTTPAVSRSSSASGRRLLGHGTGGERLAPREQDGYFANAKLRSGPSAGKRKVKRGRAGRLASGSGDLLDPQARGVDSLSELSSSEAETETDSELPSDVSDASGMTVRESYNLKLAMAAPPKFPVPAGLPSDQDTPHSSIVFSWGE
ncbi:hypothetical protein HMN09_00361300 [Mycena chlorophos]|uniref:Uncharacterized protein n=1 Tax=Mycena chlorophos TaxID=658473 RepID=A0A8H6TGM3_MYCCL|nr:hypothetical protein HMN09_00361300 [Mycena chlorophos]